MPYTRHGHWYGHDDPTHPAPMPVQRCGGLSLCPKCAIDAHRGDQGATLTYQPIYTTTVDTAQITYTPAGANPTAMPITITTPNPPSRRVTIGAQVHYVSHGTPIRPDGSQAFPSVCRAATVTETNYSDTQGDDTVGLAVLNPDGLFFHPLVKGGVPHVEPKPAGALEGGTWHYWCQP